MTTYTCPDGHDSTAGDYCDVCGAPIGGDSATGTAASTGAGSLSATPGSARTSGGAPASLLDLGTPAGTSRACPHCGGANVADALFCEDCGYDFTTGQLPRVDPPPLSPPDGRAAADAPSPLPPPLPPTPPGTPSPVPSPVPPPARGADAPTPAAGTTLGPAEWVAEVWVDPDWWAAQDVSDPCPSPGMPGVVPLAGTSLLIGRRSASRNIHPQLDCGADTGVSRRHAQLTTDGQRWWIEDLQSSNGTYIGATGRPLPSTPLTPGQRTELAEDDRIYLGAWTRIVVRRATPGEVT